MQQPVDGLELPGRGPCQQVVDGGLGDEQGAGPRPQPVDVPCVPRSSGSCVVLPPGERQVVFGQVDGLVVGDGLGPGGVSGRGQAYAGAVDAAGWSRGSRPSRPPRSPIRSRVRPAGACAAPSARTARLLPVEPFAQRGREAPSRTWLVGPGPGPVAQQPDLQGRVVAAGGVVAVGARMRRDAGPGGIEQFDLERAQPDDQLAPRMLGAGRVPVPALDGDDPVLVGLHAFPRDHVEACLRQRQQCFAVLGEQVRLATSLAVVVLVAQREAPFKQPGVERRHAPHARHRHEQLAAHRADPGLHAALLVARVRVAEHVFEPVMRLERLEQARQPHPLEHPAPHARGVIEHDPRRHAAQPLEDVAKRLARALSVLPGHKLARADVRIREIQHEMTHARHLAPEPDVDLAEIGLRLARMPHQVEVAGLALRGELAPQLRDLPRLTVDSDTSAPYSSRRRSHIRVAVCRCLRHVQRSSASHCSITGT